jgi:hypothetical protein
MHLAVQLITYDLRKPGQNYTKLFAAIEAMGTWWHCLGSVWLVQTSLTSAQVRDILRPHMDANDSLLVAGLNGNWATLGIGGECADWLRTNVA